MRVAHVLRKYNFSEWGGTETAVLQLTTALAAQSVGSAVFAPSLANARPMPDPFAEAGVPVKRFSASVPVLGISEERRQQLVSVGGNVISFALLGALWRERNIDVIHTHALGRLGAIGRVVARARGLPFVISIHGGAYDLPTATRAELNRSAREGWDWGKPLGMMLGARKLMESADAVVTMNPRETAIIRLRHPGRRILTESHGVPVAAYARDCRAAALEAYPRLRNRQVLLVLGRIDPTKNQMWVLMELAELVRRHPGVMVVFAGACTNSEYGWSIEQRIARSGLGGHVLSTGGLPSGDPRLVGLLQLARALVLPSTSETFGIVILEAWAAGTPVVSSRTSGASTLVEDGRNGLLFELGRPATFHAAIDRVLERPSYALHLSEEGRAKAAAQFDTDVCARRMRRLYEELVEEKHALRRSA
jgi:glycosyltransferase involved in cell wall biosynthesis